MTRDESLEITQMILTNWRVRDWSKEEIDAFARGIQHLEAEIAVSAVARASRDLKYAPKIAEFHEVYRAERSHLRSHLEPTPEPQGQPIPLWVKRWMCSRYLYAQFGKERDLRRFPEQGDHGDLTHELMPEGAWLDEANTMDENGAMKRWREMLRS